MNLSTNVAKPRTASSASSASGSSSSTRKPSTSTFTPSVASVYPGLCGLFAIYKPSGFTSNVVLNQLKKVINPKLTEAEVIAAITTSRSANSVSSQSSAPATAASSSSPSSSSTSSESTPPVSEPAVSIPRDADGHLMKVLIPRLPLGHGGTLDKQASGLLIIGVGKGTKLLHAQLKGRKRYFARGMLGMETNSHDLDADSRVVRQTDDYGHVTKEGLEAYLQEHYASNGGMILQRPPLYSALKQNGERLSNLVRNGQEATVELEAKDRNVEVIRITVNRFETPFFELEVQCGSGFYVRSLIRDIGAHFRCGATLVELVRLEQHGFSLDDPKKVVDMSQVMQQWHEGRLARVAAKLNGSKPCDGDSRPDEAEEDRDDDEDADEETTTSSHKTAAGVGAAVIASNSIIPLPKVSPVHPTAHGASEMFLPCTKDHILQLLQFSSK